MMAPPAMLSFWFAGLCLGSAGLLGALYPLSQLTTPDTALRRAAPPLLGLALVGLILPDIALMLQPVWKMDWLTDFTFRSVETVIILLGQNVTSIVETKSLIIDDFGVAVGPQCSGVEGFALITVFSLFYIVLFRDQLRLGRALWILPVAILLSWVLNVIVNSLIRLGCLISLFLAWVRMDIPRVYSRAVMH